MNKLSKLLFFLLVILFPTQLGMHFWPDFSFVNGIRVDYLSPTLYLTDILILSLILPFLVTTKKSLINKKTILFLLFVFVNILFSLSPLLTFYKWTKVIELGLLSFFVYENRKDSISILTKALPWALLWVSLLGIAQWVEGRSLNGIFYYLGERSFTVNTPGIALSKILSIVSLRPYSTLPHPNALAGILLVSWIILFKNIKRIKVFFLFISLIIFFTIFLTESFSIWIAIVLILIYKLVRSPNVPKRAALSFFYSLSILSPLIFSFIRQNINKFLDKSSVERINLSLVSGKIIAGSPLIGVGLGAFITQIPKYLYGKILLLQPVHNVPLLIFAEVGIFGSLCLLFFLFNLPMSAPLFVVFFTSLFDHYWITLQSPMIILAILIGISYNIPIETNK